MASSYADVTTSHVFSQAKHLREQLDTEVVPPTFASDCLQFLRLFRDHPTDCSAAVVHPLGFAVFRWDFSERDALRVHVWSDLTHQEDPEVDPRHDHRWRLRSFILVGRLIDHILGAVPVRDDEDSNDVVELARVIQQDNADVVVPTGERVRLVDRGSHDVDAGEVYTVPPGALHWTEAPPIRPIATLVSAVVEEDLVPRTLIPVGTPGRPLTPRRTLPAELRQRILDAVIHAAA